MIFAIITLKLKIRINAQFISLKKNSELWKQLLYSI